MTTTPTVRRATTRAVAPNPPAAAPVPTAGGRHAATLAPPAGGRIVPEAVRRPRMALLLPGQGSQRPGMGRPWHGRASWSVVEEISDRAARDVAALLLTADAETLRRTDNAQLAVFGLECLVLAELADRGVTESVVACAGHSLGEYTALVAAGLMSLGDAATLVAARGRSMAEAATARPGTMAVLMADAATADRLTAQARRAGHSVWTANRNSPRQTVVSGTPDGVAAACEVARAAGVAVTAIPVGGAFHTPLMQPAATVLRRAFTTVSVHPGRIPVVANVDARPHDGRHGWSEMAARQVVAPVRWQESVETLVDSLGCTLLVETGPGRALVGLARQIRPEAERLVIGTPDDVDLLAERITRG